jgi:hypothetical protein
MSTPDTELPTRGTWDWSNTYLSWRKLCIFSSTSKPRCRLLTGAMAFRDTKMAIGKKKLSKHPFLIPHCIGTYIFNLHALKVSRVKISFCPYNEQKTCYLNLIWTSRYNSK